ncbi:MAG: cobalt-precorrin-5B (C(1))-methyltransferase CbiD [Deltaproteobacteria bacterium]|nr:cobalt-precorrin-5B (C(1))-methyltransferase CbiD [Deltaproteobacteria bacterium]
MKLHMREGFTTGSAAAAAACAAVTLLLSGRDSGPDTAGIALPPFFLRDGRLTPQRGLRLDIPVACTRKDSASGRAEAAVIKDGGDDPDVTHQIRIEVFASRAACAFNGLQRSCPVRLELDGNIYLEAGPGIGCVTLPGLPVLPGEPAINPEPRKQIAFAAREAALQYGYSGPLHLFLQAPQGRSMAESTLNSRLGIHGGISILGTHGTVRPYSREAWQKTIARALDLANALDFATIAFSTGRRSEKALLAYFPGLPPQAVIQAADHARFSILAARQRQFKNIIWACYPGKLLKLAQGLAYTHADDAPADLRLLAGWAGRYGADARLCAQISALPTAQGVFKSLLQTNPEVCAKLIRHVAGTALQTLSAWMERSPLPARLTLCLFKSDHRLWLKLVRQHNPARSVEACFNS